MVTRVGNLLSSPIRFKDKDKAINSGQMPQKPIQECRQTLKVVVILISVTITS